MKAFLFASASALAAVSFLASTSRAQVTLGCTPGGSGGAFPTSGTGGGGVYPGTLPPFEFTSTLNVATLPAGATAVTEVKFFGLNHTYGSDLSIVLQDPSGAKHMLWNLQGVTCDFSGDYVCTGIGTGTTPFPACTATLIPTGSYQQGFATWPTGTNSIGNTNLSSVAPQTGNWSVTFYDWVAIDVGSLTSWDICFGTPPPPPPPPPTACNGSELDALAYAAGNGGANGGQLFFNVNVTNAAGIDVSQLDVHTDDNVGAQFTLEVWTVPTTHVGNETNQGAWTLQATGTGISAGLGLPSIVEFTDFHLAPGSYGVGLVFSSGNCGHSYTNGNGANQNFSNADLAISAGAALNVAWAGAPFTPRVFNGTIRYNCITGPVSYCTAGTSTNGCLGSASASANPSVSLANPCVITIANVEGAKNGIVFYGLTSQQIPWGGGSTSFLCVKSPAQRMAALMSGGTTGQCDGNLVQNWDTWHAANPTAQGNPWVVGEKAYVQGWFRDPPAPKTTSLSNAVELTYGP